MSPEDMIKKLQEFWLLDSGEYQVIEQLIQDRIDGLNIKIKRFEPISAYKGDDVRIHREEIGLRDFYIILKEKISYMISNGLYKKYD